MLLPPGHAPSPLLAHAVKAPPPPKPSPRLDPKPNPSPTPGSRPGSKPAAAVAQGWEREEREPAEAEAAAAGGEGKAAAGVDLVTVPVYDAAFNSGFGSTGERGGPSHPRQPYLFTRTLTALTPSHAGLNGGYWGSPLPDSSPHEATSPLATRVSSRRAAREGPVRRSRLSSNTASALASPRVSHSPAPAPSPSPASLAPFQTPPQSAPQPAAQPGLQPARQHDRRLGAGTAAAMPHGPDAVLAPELVRQRAEGASASEEEGREEDDEAMEEDDDEGEGDEGEGDEGEGDEGEARGDASNRRASRTLSSDPAELWYATHSSSNPRLRLAHCAKCCCCCT